MLTNPYNCTHSGTMDNQFWLLSMVPIILIDEKLSKYIHILSMKTFKVNCTNHNWDKLCQEISEDNGKYLAVRHVKSKKRDHVHVLIEQPNKRFRQRLVDVNKELKKQECPKHIWDYKDEAGEHSLRPRQGPLKQSSKKIKPDFINYLVKEEGWQDNIAANRGYTQEFLEEAHVRSKEYVHEKKEGLKAFITDHMSSYDSPLEMYNAFVRLCLTYYTEEEKYIVQSPKWRILSIMMHLFPNDKDVQLFVAEKI